MYGAGWQLILALDVTNIEAEAPVKSEWEFKFETRGFRFEREHKYTANPEAPIRLGDRPPELIECLVRIVPRDIKPPPLVEQVGSLHVLLPHSRDDTRLFAYHVANMIADRITFQQGDFRLLAGLVVCKRIAETAQEEVQFGEELYYVDMRLQEIDETTPTFDSSRITTVPATPQHVALISQFNETKRDKSAIRQFLGYFRIIESIYVTTDSKLTLKQVLLQSPDLQAIYGVLVQGESFESLVRKLVDIRHQCAHLKLSTGFGYVPIDPAVDHEVKPRLPLLAALAYYSIVGTQELPK